MSKHLDFYNHISPILCHYWNICFTFTEKKAKEADKQIRELARKARTEYKESLRRSFTMMQATQAFQSSTGNNKDKPAKPPLPPK